MIGLPATRTDAFNDGVLTRLEGYNKHFNPFRNDKENKLYQEWLKGWLNQNRVMLQS